MPVKEIIIDSSPLIALFRSHQAQLLAQLFTNIWVPNAVWEEVSNNEHHDLASQGLINTTWLKRVNVTDIPDIISQRNLGLGESEVLAFALNLKSAHAMIDDLAARRCAKMLGIATLGTGGMLVIAKQRGIISSVGEALQALRAAGMWLSDDLVQMLTEKAGESNSPPLPNS
jgi:predicted nucleic acid-binding protein